MGAWRGQSLEVKAPKPELLAGEVLGAGGINAPRPRRAGTKGQSGLEAFLFTGGWKWGWVQ